ncbi:hypothetical protein MMC11_000602 [Xylographa trunciseda]|nr:hypothetical protein [Xylographa trunciseda]
MLNSDYKLTFGVELELIFVFHEKLLIAQLRIEDGRRPYTKRSGAWVDGRTLLKHQATLRKDLSDQVREELRQGAPHYQNKNPHYLGWGLTTKRGLAARSRRPFTGNRIEGMRIHRAEDDTLVRTYDLEPVRMAREVLLSDGAFDMWRSSGHPSYNTGLRIGVRSGEGSHKPVLSFRNWHITNDFSLSGLSRDELAAYLEKHKVCSGRDGPGASPFSNGLALNSIKNVYRPASESTSARSQGEQVQGVDILSALDNLLSSAQKDLAAHRQEQGASDPSASSVIAQDGSVLGKRKPGDITDEPLGKRTRLSASPELGKKQIGLPDVNDWDAYGIELVSKVLRPVREDFDTIARFCNLLKGEPCHDHGATINDTCGLHVHLKPDDDGIDFDLNTLQHLAYLVAIYEAEIDELHPFHRRTYDPFGATEYDFQSNTQRLRDSNGELLAPFRGIQKLIGATKSKQELQQLMGKGKGYLVNFSNFLRRNPTDGPRTIEFRQHEGVLRGEMVEWWVKFCIGLLQLANHAATQQNADGSPIEGFYRQCEIYPFFDINDCLSVWDLFDLMDFPEDGRRYFQRRAAYFADNPAGRDPTASLHTSDYGYKGPRRYKTSDPPSHSDLTTSASRDSRSSSLINQIVRRVQQHLEATTRADRELENEKILALSSDADWQAAADRLCAEAAAKGAAAVEQVREKSKGESAKAQEHLKRPVATRAATAENANDESSGAENANDKDSAAKKQAFDRAAAKTYPVPRPGSPNPFNPLPRDSTITYNQLPSNTFAYAPGNDTLPIVQPWIPVNSPQGNEILQNQELSRLTGSSYETKKTKIPPRPRRSPVNPNRWPKNPRDSRPRPLSSSHQSSNPSTSSPLRNVITASPPAETVPGPTSSDPFTPVDSVQPVRAAEMTSSSSDEVLLGFVPTLSVVMEESEGEGEGEGKTEGTGTGRRREWGPRRRR